MHRAFSVAGSVFTLLCGAYSVPPANAQNSRTFETSVQPFLARTCYPCHNAKRQSGSLNLERYTTAASVTADRDRWEQVLRKLQAGEMPPPGVPRPPEAEIKAVTSWIGNEFERADASAKPDPGHVTARRLNRAEYNNSVRDLLGVDLRLADNFPQDDSGYGFDNIGDVLSLSPVLMEMYVSAAEKSVRTALFGTTNMKPALVRYQPPFRRRADGTAGGSFKGPATFTYTDYDLTGLTMPSALHAVHWFPVDAEYLFNATPAGQRPGASELIHMAIWIDGKMTAEVPVEPIDPDTFVDDISGQTKQFRARVPAGEHWIAVTLLRQFEGVPASYGGLNPSRKPPPSSAVPSFLTPPPNATPQQIAELAARREAFGTRKLDLNNIRIDNLEIGGPYNQAKGPSAESLRRIYVCGHLDGHHNPSCERKILTSFARRAYRRPVTESETEHLLALAALARKQGDSFEEGLAVAMESALVSPGFLFRIESAAPAKQGAVGAVGEYELASRLSYFLWSSTPDEELLRAAAAGELRRRDQLATQVRRMLKDPKSEALVREFGGQWLGFRGLESVTPDRERFPDFEDYLRLSMRTETEMFFSSILREDRSISDFIGANYTFLNERLAQLYGIPDVKGPEFRRVDLTGRLERGGVLTQASVLTVSSYATRTSPVLRGKWVLENFLNAPPPPPPPNVPNLDDAGVGTSTSLRTQMEKHRSNAVCASCHARMDPLGFGLENYDAIGAWRAKDGKFPIDATGALPDGRTFDGPRELKTILGQDREAFTRCLTEKLMIYALGRGLERYDKPTVNGIVTRLDTADPAFPSPRFSSVVLEIVNSLPFQMRRSSGVKDDRQM